MQKNNRKSGFTLIELSIVLVIIGLIIGGVLTGQDLINAATIRAQISQIENYQTAVHTFELKYGYLPGDIPDPTASAFGFGARGGLAGQGDGNGLIEGRDTLVGTTCTDYYNTYPNCGGNQVGETTTFWVDLSTAGLIKGVFNRASPTSLNAGATTHINANSTPSLSNYYPIAKISGNGFVYVWSGFRRSNGLPDVRHDVNYFAVDSIFWVINSGNLTATIISHFTSATQPQFVITPTQAYNIDTKIDDGLPASGNVFAAAIGSTGFIQWVSLTSTSPTSATDATATTCYDNSNSVTATGQAGVVPHYSLGYGSSPNTGSCALSFMFQ